MNSNVYLKIICQSDYLRSICLFLEITSILKTIPRISTFHYHFINNISQSKLIDTCIKFEFGDLLKSLKMNPTYSTTTNKQESPQEKATISKQLSYVFGDLDNFSSFVRKYTRNAHLNNNTNTQQEMHKYIHELQKQKTKTSKSQRYYDLQRIFELNNYGMIKYWLHIVFKSIIKKMRTIHNISTHGINFSIVFKCTSSQSKFNYNPYNMTGTTTVSISSDILESNITCNNSNVNTSNTKSEENDNINNNDNNIVTFTVAYKCDNLSNNVFDNICQLLKIMVTQCNKNDEILSMLVKKFEKMFINAQVVNVFDKIRLKDKLLKGIYANGLEKASINIKSRAILTTISKFDGIFECESGRKETASYLIASLQLLDENIKNCCQMVILCPTHDRAQGVHRICVSLAQFMTSPNPNSKSITNHISPQCVTGTVVVDATGLADLKQDIKACKEGKQIIIGTPGRINNLINHQALDLNKLTLVVLDQFDEMLSRGFKAQIEDILSHIPKHNTVNKLPTEENQECQLVIFSGIISNEITLFEQKYLDQNNTLKFAHYNAGITLEGIVQSYVFVEKEHYKYSTLIEIFELLNVGKTPVIIYCATPRKMNWLAEKMREDNYTGMFLLTTVINLNTIDFVYMTQNERLLRMGQFRMGTSSILIVNDFVSRPHDISAMSVSLVIQYDVPNHRQTYIHRIARRGRYGRTRYSIMFLTVEDEDKQVVKDIETFYDTKIEELEDDFQTYWHLP